MKFGSKIPLVDKWTWLSTPNQTPARGDSSYVQYVYSDGGVNYNDCDWSDKSVRPFWIGRRRKVGVTPKLESRYQKNEQPFLSRKNQDKYKGIQYYDRK